MCMVKSIDVLKYIFIFICIGCVLLLLLDWIIVKVYGIDMLFNQVVLISVFEGYLLVIMLFDKGMIKDVEKVIYVFDFGLILNVVGIVICLNLLLLIEECCKELGKQVQKEGEGVKIVICNICQDVNKVIVVLFKDKLISEDDKKCGEDDIQKLIDKFIKDVDSVVVEKEKELMVV